MCQKPDILRNLERDVYFVTKLRFCCRGIKNVCMQWKFIDITFDIWYIYEIYWTDKDINFVNYPVVTKRSPFLNSMPVTVTQMRVGKSSGDAFMQQNINIHL